MSVNFGRWPQPADGLTTQSLASVDWWRVSAAQAVRLRGGIDWLPRPV